MEEYMYAGAYARYGHKKLVVFSIEDYTDSDISSGKGFYEFLSVSADIKHILDNPQEYDIRAGDVSEPGGETGSWVSEEDVLKYIDGLSENSEVFAAGFSQDTSIYDLALMADRFLKGVERGISIGANDAILDLKVKSHVAHRLEQDARASADTRTAWFYEGVRHGLGEAIDLLLPRVKSGDMRKGE